MARRPHPLSRSHRLLLLLATVSAASLAAGPAHADTAVAQLDRPSPIAAQGGVVAWSAYDAATRRFHLVLRRGRAVARAAIAPAVAPFDVSLGRDAAGRLVALYPRCDQPGGARRRPSGCDIYRYDVTAGREDLVSEVSRADRDEGWPAQSGRRVAFVALRGKGPGSRPCDVPYVKTLAAAGPARRLDRGRCSRTTGLSLQGDRIVQLTAGPGRFASPSEVRRLNVRGGRMHLLARVRSEDVGGRNEYTGTPALTRAAVYLLRQTPTGNRFVRIGLGSGRRTEVPAHADLIGAFARDERGRSWYVDAQPTFDCGYEQATDVPCRLVQTSASPFSSATRRLAPHLRFARGGFDGLEVSGRLDRLVVRGRRVLRREPLAGVAVELLGRLRDSSSPYAPTGLRTTTGADGRWTVHAAGQPNATEFFAVTRGPGVNSSASEPLVGPELFE